MPEVKQDESAELENYRLNLVLIQETAARIIKDFDLFGFDILFSGKEETAYEKELSKQLKPVIGSILSSNRQKLMRMLYIIDIPEEKLNQP